MRRIYLDHNATTPLAAEVREAILPFLDARFGNPSSAHSLGRDARAALDEARRSVASAVGARPSEVVFTASATEAITLAIRGVAAAGGARRPHVVTSTIEHTATLRATGALADEGAAEVTVVPVGSDGRFRAEDVLAAVRPETALVTLMHANNETGVVQPVAEVGRALAGRVPLHVDAAQTLGKLPVSMEALGCSLLTVSGHKIYGPKGAGALVVRRGVRLVPLVHGHQERGLRGGTENMLGVVGLGAACARVGELLSLMPRVAALRDRLEEGVRRIPGAHVHGAGADRIANTLSVRFDDVDGESLLIHLDLEGIAASSGSACTTGETRPSHVLTAMGLTPVQAHGALRLSLGVDTTAEDIDATLAALPRIVARVREE